MGCLSISKAKFNIMIAGLENSGNNLLNEGKTYFLYSKLLKLITPGVNITTTPTLGFILR